MDLPSKSRDWVILLLTLALTAGIVFTSMTGLLTDDFYYRETFNWQAQSLGQDMVDLFLVTPVLLISGLMAWSGRNTARWIWGGTLLYLVYTFCLYCFDVHFNSLFLFYCFNLGLSFYGLLYFLYTSRHRHLVDWPVTKRLRRIIALYFIIVGILFYGLWLGEVIPAMISGVVPASLLDTGLPTNGVHVIDLSVFLPGLILAGSLLWKKHALGYLLAPLGLTFMILMDITIGGLMVYMHLKGLAASLEVAIVMFILATFTLYLLIRYLSASGVQPNQSVSDVV